MALVYFVWFLSTYFVVLFLLLIITNRKELYEERMPWINESRKVSIVVAAYNEEDKITDTIESLRRVDHKDMEIIIVNDGSKDNTRKIVHSFLHDKRIMLIDNAENKGKAACLNQGIKAASGEFVATMDADSIVEKKILVKTLPYFDEKKVGAVTVTVEVREPKTFLHKMIDLEYILGLSLFLKIFSKIDTVHVTPGPFSIYKKNVLVELGGFDVNNITEDLEIAYRIHKAGYKIRNCMDAKVLTLLPETFKGLYIQRKRWYTGAIKTLFQHRSMMLRRKYGLFSFFIPFNFLLITLGLVLFLYSTYLGTSTLIENAVYYQYTNFNFVDKILRFNFDFLALGGVWFLSLSSITGVLLVLTIGLSVSNIRYKEKKLGILGYPLLFFIYQIFWLASYIAVFRRKKIKWR